MNNIIQNISDGENVGKDTVDFTDDYPKLSKEDKKKYTILVPTMLPYHFEVLQHVFEKAGYKIVVLENTSRAVIDEGLKHTHNDACFPALCVIGQFIDALKSGKYDVNHTAVLMTQTGGGCRASNYIALIRKALKAEFPQVPVLSLNFSGLEKDSGIEFPVSVLLMVVYAIIYGDVIMSIYNQTRPYELNSGDSDKTRRKCIEYLNACFDNNSYRKYKKITRRLIEEFSSVPVSKEEKIKVGIVGEIYVKYSPLANSHLEEFLISENCEPVVPSLMDFVLYCIANILNDKTYYGHKTKFRFVYVFVYKLLLSVQKNIRKEYLRSGRYEPMHDFNHVRECADKVINQGVKMGEGWLIPAEMAAMAETGTENIVCAQPFGCLPNHIVGKGTIRTLKEMYEDENIVAIDYDPSSTKVNQENRIKLMIATAVENKKNKTKKN